MAYLYLEAVILKYIVGAHVPHEEPQGGEHTLADVVSSIPCLSEKSREFNDSFVPWKVFTLQEDNVEAFFD